MSDDVGQGFVRAARLIDAADFAAVQHRSWLAASQSLDLPEPPRLDHIERAWERAITAPPSDRHRSWVAVDRSAASETVVGVAALAPASDPDLDSARCVELVLLTVDPTSRRHGHGSRLLVAAMETAEQEGEREAVTWVPSGDDTVRRFLEDAGWAADGAFRTLSDGRGPADDPATDAQLRQVRLATALGGPSEGDAEGEPSDEPSQ